MKTIKEYFSKLFLVYWIRWLFSAVIMLPFMVLFESCGIGLTLNLFLGQTIGAIIFFELDRFIFKFFDR